MVRQYPGPELSVLRGRCRDCKEPISPRYPAVELLTGLLFLAVYLYYPPIQRDYFNGGLLVADYGFIMLFTCLLTVVFFSDYETEIIPDELVLIGIPAGLLWHFLNGALVPAVLSCALGYSLLFLVSKIGKLIYKKDALGYGDVKLAAMLGAWLPADRLLLALFLGYLIGALWALLLLALKMKKMGDYIPFGPALCAGALIALFFGAEISGFYLANFF
jgi:leader peptidase (prepilin peptidase) / N-methyltransferase